jgi:hypothetical protein
MVYTNTNKKLVVCYITLRMSHLKEQHLNSDVSSGHNVCLEVTHTNDLQLWEKVHQSYCSKEILVPHFKCKLAQTVVCT